MIEMLLTGWFIVSSHTLDKGQHNYLLVDMIQNHHVAYSNTEPLSEGEGSWIKLRMQLECNFVLEPPFAPGLQAVKNYYCDASRVIELKCTEKNSYVVGGKRYC